METTFIYDRFVTGKNNIGRKADCDHMRSALRSGKNVVIYEPPKAGKTSLIRQTFYDMKLSGERFVNAEANFLSCRSLSEVAIKIATALVGVAASTPDEHRYLVEHYLGGTHFCFDLRAFARKDRYISLNGPIDEQDIRSVLILPYLAASESNFKLYFVLEEFQNISLCEGYESFLKIFDEVCRKTPAKLRSACSWIWCGSQVNAMKSIFEGPGRYFAKSSERVKLHDIAYRDIETFLVRGFLSSGKVIEKSQVASIFKILKGNIWYITHFAAICDGLSRGYIIPSVFQESVDALLSVHHGRFVSMMNDLTTYQVFLLRAILDGKTQLSSADTIERYSLNSSANVNRLKSALCRKEIITFDEMDRPLILDPLFEYWLHNYYWA